MEYDLPQNDTGKAVNEAELSDPCSISQSRTPFDKLIKNDLWIVYVRSLAHRTRQNL